MTLILFALLLLAESGRADVTVGDGGRCDGDFRVVTRIKPTQILDIQTGLFEMIEGVVHDLSASESVTVRVNEPKDRALTSAELAAIHERVGRSLHRAFKFYDHLVPASGVGSNLARSLFVSVDLYHRGKLSPWLQAKDDHIYTTTAEDHAPIITYDRLIKDWKQIDRSPYLIRHMLAHEAAHFMIYHWFPKDTYYVLMPMHEAFADYLAWLESERSPEFLAALRADRGASTDRNYRASLDVLERLIDLSPPGMTTSQLAARFGKILDVLKAAKPGAVADVLRAL